MLMYNLTDSQKEALRGIVAMIRAEMIEEEFGLYSVAGKPALFFLDLAHIDRSIPYPIITSGTLNALQAAGLILYTPKPNAHRVTILGKAYEAVDSDFGSPDTSFLRYLEPLPADISTLDSDIIARCLGGLATGSTPINWDHAVRQACLVLEERLRNTGGMADSKLAGRELAYQVFGKNGTLTAKVGDPDGYRDLFAGAMAVIRNPFAHRFIDPTPEDGGTYIRFVDLLLRMLRDL